MPCLMDLWVSEQVQEDRCEGGGGDHSGNDGVCIRTEARCVGPGQLVLAAYEEPYVRIFEFQEVQHVLNGCDRA